MQRSHYGALRLLQSPGSNDKRGHAVSRRILFLFAFMSVNCENYFFTVARRD